MSDPTLITVSNWRDELPVLSARTVTLREPASSDLGPLVDLLSLGDATRFGLDEPVSEVAVQQLIERAARDRAAGRAFSYVITLTATRTVIGLMQVRPASRFFVTGVIVIGLVLLLVFVPEATFDQLLLFVALLALSSATAALKVHLPLTTSGSTMSVSYAVDFASLLLLGPHETMLVAAGSAFSQCNLNRKEGQRNPLYRTLFSAASLVITVHVAGLVFHMLGGMPSHTPLTVARPLVGAATVYFLLNTGLVATAIALSTRSGLVSTWHNNFLWSAPSYFV